GGQTADSFRVGPRETSIGCILPWQPLARQVFARREADRHGLRQAQPEHVLLVVRDARRVAPSPVHEDLEPVAQLPVPERIASRIQARLLENLAYRGLLQRLAFVLTAGDRLPESG